MPSKGRERWSSANIPDLSGRVVVVTGANSGLGLEISEKLARHGAGVVMACRNSAKAERARAALLEKYPGLDLQIAQLDLADLGSVAEFAAKFRSGHDRLDILINNAGLMAVDQSHTAQGFETQFGVNHLGHFALTRELLPILESTPGSRIANMSSMGHRGGRMNFADLMRERHYSRWFAYTQSKLANLLFTRELHRRLSESGSPTIAVAAHPGAARTDLGSEGSGITNKISTFFYPYVTQSVQAGALPMLRAVTAPDVVGGEFYGCRFVAVGRPVLETPSRRARSDADARHLWDVSDQLVSSATG